MNIKSTKRKLIILTEIEEGDNSEQFCRIVNSFISFPINNFLSNSNKRLSQVLSNELPGLSVIKGDKSCIYSEDTLIRFILHESNKPIISNNLDKINSHVVDIAVGSENDLHSNIDEYELRAIINTEEELYNIIEDVMLDIQMFYYKGFDLYYNTLEKRKIFSLLKVDFCQKKSNNHISSRYYALASLCRKKDHKLDYEQYKLLWKEFTEVVNGTRISTIPSTQNETLLNEITHLHPYGSQINKKKLNKMINDLETGHYILAYLFKKPRIKKVQKKILPLFRSSKLKRGSMIVVPYEKRVKYSKHFKYIFIYNFTKIAGNEDEKER